MIHRVAPHKHTYIDAVKQNVGNLIHITLLLCSKQNSELFKEHLGSTVIPLQTDKMTEFIAQVGHIYQ